MSKTYPLTVEQTKKGFPAIWECGGGMSSTGKATVIAAPDGTRLKPFYVRTGGQLALSDHALLPVAIGTIVVSVRRHYKDYSIHVSRVVSDTYRDTLDRLTVNCEELYSYQQGEWDAELPEWMVPVVSAAKEKSWCYHCREPHYVKEEE